MFVVNHLSLVSATPSIQSTTIDYPVVDCWHHCTDTWWSPSSCCTSVAFNLHLVTSSISTTIRSSSLILYRHPRNSKTAHKRNATPRCHHCSNLRFGSLISPEKSLQAEILILITTPSTRKLMHHCASWSPAFA